MKWPVPRKYAPTLPDPDIVASAPGRWHLVSTAIANINSSSKYISTNTKILFVAAAYYQKSRRGVNLKNLKSYKIIPKEPPWLKFDASKLTQYYCWDWQNTGLGIPWDLDLNCVRSGLSSGRVAFIKSGDAGCVRWEDEGGPLAFHNRGGRNWSKLMERFIALKLQLTNKKTKLCEKGKRSSWT